MVNFSKLLSLLYKSPEDRKLYSSDLYPAGAYGSTLSRACFLNFLHLGPLFNFFWSFGVFFGPFGLFLGKDQAQEQFVETAYVVNQLWFWKYSPMFLLIIRPYLGRFFVLWGLSGLFLGLWLVSKTFLGPTYIE